MTVSTLVPIPACRMGVAEMVTREVLRVESLVLQSRCWCGSGLDVGHLPWVLTELVFYRAVLTGMELPASHSGDKCYSSTFCRETKHSLLLKSDSVNVPFVV